MEFDIGEIIVDEEISIGNVELDVIKLVPELEDLEVMPSTEEQNFKSSKYGYNNVKVAGSENLLPANIKKDVDIFGVTGTGNMTTAKITNGGYLFYKNARTDYIQEILALCGSLTNTEHMFGSCSTLESLDISNLDLSNVENIYQMFVGCSKLKSLDLSNLNTKKITSFYQLFNGCASLVELNLSNWDTSNVTTMQNMFYGCNDLKTLDLSNFDASKVTTITSMFANCISLENLRSFKNLGKGYTQKNENSSSYALDFTRGPKLSHESLIDVINNLYDLNLTYDVANGGTLYRQSLKLGATHLAKLTADEIAIAENKGWNVT